jgi:hypothetical protein
VVGRHMYEAWNCISIRFCNLLLCVNQLIYSGKMIKLRRGKNYLFLLVLFHQLLLRILAGSAMVVGAAP